MTTEPVRTAFIPIILAALAAAVQAFATGADTRGIIAAGLAALVLAGQEFARARVRPNYGPVPSDDDAVESWRPKKTEAGLVLLEAVVLLLVVAVVVLAILVL